MEFLIKYDEDAKPIEVSFRPDLVSSKGEYNHKLGNLALTKLGIKDWRWDSEKLYRVIIDPQYVLIARTIIQEAQDQVTQLIDRLLEWDNYRRVFDDYCQGQNK